MRILMDTVRVYLNRHEGTTWWAEDDLGFTGGADRLSDLIEMIHEWAESEDVPDGLEVRLVSDASKDRIVDPFSVTGLPQPRSANSSDVRHVGPARITG